jgi:hypothetical protein
VSSDLAAIAGVEVLTRLAALRLGPGLEDGVELGRWSTPQRGTRWRAW